MVEAHPSKEGNIQTGHQVLSSFPEAAAHIHKLPGDSISMGKRFTNRKHNGMYELRLLHVEAQLALVREVTGMRMWLVYAPFACHGPVLGVGNEVLGRPEEKSTYKLQFQPAIHVNTIKAFVAWGRPMSDRC